MRYPGNATTADILHATREQKFSALEFDIWFVASNSPLLPNSISDCVCVCHHPAPVAPFPFSDGVFPSPFGRANITSNAVSGYLFDVVFLNSWFDRRIHNPSFYFTLSLLRNSRHMVITRARVQLTRIPLPLLLQSWAHHQCLRLRR